MRRVLAGLAIVLALIDGAAVPARAQGCCAAFAPAPIPALSTSQITFVPVTVTNTGDVEWPGNGNTSFVLSYVLLNGNLGAIAFGQATLFPTTVTEGRERHTPSPAPGAKSTGDVHRYGGSSGATTPNSRTTTTAPRRSTRASK